MSWLTLMSVKPVVPTYRLDSSCSQCCSCFQERGAMLSTELPTDLLNICCGQGNGESYLQTLVPALEKSVIINLVFIQIVLLLPYCCLLCMIAAHVLNTVTPLIVCSWTLPRHLTLCRMNIF